MFDGDDDDAASAPSAPMRGAGEVEMAASEWDRTCRRGCRCRRVDHARQAPVSAAWRDAARRCHIASSSSGMPAPVAAGDTRRTAGPARRRAVASAATRVLVVDRVDLVGGDDLRLGGQRRLEQLELLAHDVEIVDRIAAGRARHVDQVHEHLGAFEVPQELVAEALAAMRAFDQARARRRRRSCDRRSGRTTPRFGVSVVKG